MRRTLLIVCICLFAFPAHAAQRGRANVHVHLQADGVHAHYTLDRAVTRFDFAPTDAVRGEDLAVLTPGLSLNDDAIVAAAAFRSFDILVKPFAHERDAKYPGFFRIGDGGVLYGPILSGDQTWRMGLEINAAPGQIHLPASPTLSGSIYLGPGAYVASENGADIISAPDSPRALRDAVTRDAAAAMQLYTTRLHATLATRPVIAIAQGGAGAGWVGDVTPGPFMSLRFYGAPDDQVSVENAQRVMTFVMHEAFHFWNGSLVQNAEATPSWLIEGGADFASLRASMTAGGLDDAGMDAALGHALYNCRQALQQHNDAALNDVQFLSMDVRYPCGVIIQWAASLQAVKTHRGDFFDIWARMIAAARARQSRTFDLKDFYAAAALDPHAPTSPLYLLTATEGPARWPRLVAALQALGAEIHEAPTPETRRTSLIFHLLGQSCGDGARGFSINNNVLKLDGNATCGVLAGAPGLTRIEGADALAPTEAAYAAAQARCASNAPVRLVLDGRAVAAPCHARLADAPNDYVVARWR